METKICAKCKCAKSHEEFSSGAFTQRYGQCRECVSKQGAKFRKAHKNDPPKQKTPEQIAARKAYEAKYQEENEEKLREKQAEYRRKNRSNLNEKQKLAYQMEDESTRARRKQKNKEWNEAHKEEIRLYHAKYREENREQIKAQKKRT